MFKATIDGQDYDVAQGWNDITLKQFNELCKVKVPAKLSTLWFSVTDKAKYEAASAAMTFEVVHKTLPKFYQQVAAKLSTIPLAVLERFDVGLLAQLYYDYLHQFVISTLLPVPMWRNKQGKIIEYKPRYRKTFAFRGVTYNMPDMERVFGNMIPMLREMTVTFAEAADLEIALHEWSEHGMEAMATIVATYCRKPNEAYDELVTKQRAKLFTQLPMDIVWRVFFYILNCEKQLQNATRKYMVMLAIAAGRQQRAQQN